MNDAAHSANLTNRQVEDADIAFMLQWEAVHGHPAHDTRGRGAAGDVASPARSIEVRACGGSARGHDL